jgi:hypothetical protein
VALQESRTRARGCAFWCDWTFGEGRTNARRVASTSRLITISTKAVRPIRASGVWKDRWPPKSSSTPMAMLVETAECPPSSICRKKSRLP